MQNYAEGLEQTYQIMKSDIFIDIDDILINIESSVEQGISVVHGEIKKGQKWFTNNKEDGYVVWLLNKIEKNDKDMKLIFIPHPKEEKIKDKEKLNQHTKDFIKSMNLNKIELEDVVYKILKHVFTTRQLNKMLISDDVEFIMDNNWAYIRVNDKAYRV